MYKPVILLGNGVRRNPALVEYLCGLGVPVLTTWPAADLLPEDSPVFCGRPGVLGQRAANIIQQKATDFYIFGARMDEAQRAFSWNIAPKAYKRIYDCCYYELDKVPADWFIQNINLTMVSDPTNGMPEIENSPSWLSWCKSLYARFRPELDGGNDYFRFINWLSQNGKSNDIYVTGAGGAGEAFMQTFKVKQGQRIISLCTNGAMGSCVPLAIGAAIAGNGRRVICVTGDGGFVMNKNELEVAKRLRLNIHFYVFCNNGYGSIRNSQMAWFGRKVGADYESGLTLPPIEESNMVMPVYVDPDWKQYPRVMSHDMIPDAFEDMTPKIPDLAELVAWDGDE